MTDAQYQYTFEPHRLHGSEIAGQDFPFGYITKFRGAERIPLEIGLVLGSKQENLDVINYIIVSCNEYPKLKEQNERLIQALRGMIRASDEFAYQAVCRGLSSDESYKGIVRWLII